MGNEENKYKVWECKIVVSGDSDIPNEFDFPPRYAAISAVEKEGIEVLACFSGWGGSIDEIQKSIIEDE